MDRGIRVGIFDELLLVCRRVDGKKLCGLGTWQAEKQYICRKYWI